jgi:hypothetical protein
MHSAVGGRQGRHSQPLTMGLNDARPRRLHHPDLRDHRRDVYDYHRRANDPGGDLIIPARDQRRWGAVRWRPSADSAPPTDHPSAECHGKPDEAWRTLEEAASVPEWNVIAPLLGSPGFLMRPLLCRGYRTLRVEPLFPSGRAAQACRKKSGMAAADHLIRMPSVFRIMEPWAACYVLRA